MIDWFEIPETETTTELVDVLWTYKANYDNFPKEVKVINGDVLGAIHSAFFGYQEAFFRDAVFHVFFRDGRQPQRISSLLAAIAEQNLINAGAFDDDEDDADLAMEIIAERRQFNFD